MLRYIKILITLGLLAVTLASVPARSAEDPGDARYGAASALFIQEKYAEAAPALEKFLAEFPKHPKAAQARLRWGHALLALEKPEPAAVAFEAVLQDTTAPDLRPEAMLGLGRARMSLGKPELAATAFEAVLKDNTIPALRPEALVGLGRARVALKDDARAVEALTEAFRLTEGDRDLALPTALLLGDALFRQGGFAEAARAFERAIQSPDHADAPRAHLMAADSYRRAGNHAAAALLFRQTVERYPRLPLAAGAALGAGDAFLAAGKPRDAEAEYRRVLSDYGGSPQAPRAQLGLGRVAHTRGDYVTARSAFAAASVLFPSAGIAPEAELRTGDTYLAERNFAEARKRYRASVSAPEPLVRYEAQYSLALVDQQEGELGPAADALRKLAETPAAGRWAQAARIRLAQIRASAGDHAAAVTLLRATLAEKPEPATRDEASLLLAEALMEQGEFANAEVELKALVARSPGSRLATVAAVHAARARLEQMDAAGALAGASGALAGELEPDIRAAALAVRGRAELRLKNPSGAATLREVLEKHPDAPVAPGAAQALLAHYRDAKEAPAAAEIEKLIAQRYAEPGGGADALLARAEAEAQAGRAEEAGKLFTQVLEGQRDRTRRLKARAGLAELAAATGNAEAVSGQLAELARDAPAPALLARTHYRVARALERAGDEPAAMASYRAAMAAGPEEDVRPGVLLGVGRLLSVGEKPAEGEAPLRELIAKYPKSELLPEALYALAWSTLDRGGWTAARPIFARLVADHPSHPLAADAGFRIGEQDYDAGDFAAAVERYRAASGSRAGIAEQAGYKLGWALRQSGDHAGAAEAFRTLAERFPKSALAAEARVRAGEASLQLKRDEDALAEFRAVLDLEPGSAEERAVQVQAGVGAARVQLARGEHEAARELAEPLAVASNGWYGGRAQLIRAEAVLRKEGPKEAVAHYLRAATLFGRYRDIAAEAHFGAAECYEKLGSAQAARAAWQRVMDLHPGSEWAKRSRTRIDAQPAASAGPAR